MKLLQLWIFAAPFFKNPDNREALLEGCETAHENHMDLHAFLAQANACMNHDTLSRVSELSQFPTLITVGDQDIFTPVNFSVQLHQLIKGSELKIYSGTGHAHHWEVLEDFNRDTTEFMLKYSKN